MRPLEKEKIEELYINQGLPMHEVADILGVSVGSVYNYIKKYGIPSRPPYKGFKGHHLSDEAKAKISSCNKGRSFSESTRQKMSEAKRIGGIGHKKVRPDGYIKIYFPDHPKATKDGYIMEHDLVMECLIGRHLRDDECVHHIDFNRQNNKKENLKLMTKSEHMSYHMKLRHAQKKEG